MLCNMASSGGFSSTVCSNIEVFTVLMTNECLDMRKTVCLKLYTRVQTYFQWTKRMWQVLLSWLPVQSDPPILNKCYRGKKAEDHTICYHLFQFSIIDHLSHMQVRKKEHCKLLNPTDHIFPLLLQIQLNRWCLSGQSHLVCFQENTKLQ